MSSSRPENTLRSFVVDSAYPRRSTRFRRGGPSPANWPTQRAVKQTAPAKVASEGFPCSQSYLVSPQGRVRAHPVRIPDRRGDHIAARRMERLADATLPRASAARAVAVRLDAVLVPRGQRAVARLGDGDRLRGTIVHDPAVDR